MKFAFLKLFIVTCVAVGGVGSTPTMDYSWASFPEAMTVKSRISASPQLQVEFKPLPLPPVMPEASINIAVPVKPLSMPHQLPRHMNLTKKDNQINVLPELSSMASKIYSLVSEEI